MKGFRKAILVKSILVGSLLTASAITFAGDWDIGVGPGYASGIADVADLYEANMEVGNYSEVDVTLIPVGVAFKAYYQAENGFRAGMGAGPLFLILGDAEHTELPLSGYVGYRFFQSSTVTPYINVGAVYHVVSGDYVEDSTPGMIAAIGLEFGAKNRVSYALEIAIDKSEVEFEKVNSYYSSYYSGYSYSSYYSTRSTTEKLNTYDTTLSFYVLF